MKTKKERISLWRRRDGWALFPTLLHVGCYFSGEDFADLCLVGGVCHIAFDHLLAAGTEIGVEEYEGGVVAGLLLVRLPKEKLMKHNLTSGFFLEDTALQQGALLQLDRNIILFEGTDIGQLGNTDIRFTGDFVRSLSLDRDTERLDPGSHSFHQPSQRFIETEQRILFHLVIIPSRDQFEDADLEHDPGSYHLVGDSPGIGKDILRVHV